MIGEMNMQVEKLSKSSLGPRHLDKVPAAAKLKLQTCEMDKPGVSDKLVFYRPPLRWRPRLETRSAAHKTDKSPPRMYFMGKMIAAEKLKLHTYEMDEPNMVDKFVFCCPPLRGRPRLGK